MATSPAFKQWLAEVYAKGCDMCHSMAWKITESGNYQCDHCANILPAFVEPTIETTAPRAQGGVMTWERAGYSEHIYCAADGRVLARVSETYRTATAQVGNGDRVEFNSVANAKAYVEKRLTGGISA